VKITEQFLQSLSNSFCQKLLLTSSPANFLFLLAKRYCFKERNCGSTEQGPRDELVNK